ncbi:MAG: Pseudoalteromonas phage Pq0, partial [Bacteroidota bacterium]
FISELNSKFGQSIIKGGKKGTHTWVHPLLFVDIALNIDIKLKIEVYQWIYDELLKYRNDSGDSYKKMCTSLFNNCTNKSNFHRSITKTAELIKSACNVEKWETASEDKLKLRDKIHENISLLCDVLRDNNQAIRIGIIKAIEQK